MNWTKINFGKHEGKSLPQVIFDDPDWFFYAYKEGYFKNGLAFEAREVYRRARSIRIPERDGQKQMVKYHFIAQGNSVWKPITPIEQAGP